MIGKFPDLRSLVYPNATAPSELAIDVRPDKDFRAQYVKSIQEMSRNHGLTDKQVQDVILKLYAFETGGTGGFDLVSGMNQNTVGGLTDKVLGLFGLQSTEIQPSDHDYVPNESTAIGYKQLIMATTMGNISNDGGNMSQQLKDRAQEITDPAVKARLLAKADFIGKLPTLMLDIAEKSYLIDKPGANLTGLKPWTLFDALSKSPNPVTLPDGRTMTGREFTSSIQALNLDIDLGPLIQASQLRSLIQDWHPDTTKGPKDNVSSDLKTSLDNFVTHANDQISQFDASPFEAKMKALNTMIEQAFKDSSTSGIETVMKNAVIRKLTESFKNGTEPDFNPGEKKFLFDNLLLNKVFLGPNMDGKSLATSPEAQDVSRLFYKLNSLYYGGLSAEKLTPAVFELSNLAGAPQAKRMLDPALTEWRTVNFVNRGGYIANAIFANRSAAEVLFAINRVQHGPKVDESRSGIKAFKILFESMK
jgi:hypothetical protein